MNFKKIGLGLAATAAMTTGVAMTEAPAQALTLDFSAGTSSVSPLLEFNAGGINVKATATPSVFGVSRKVFQGSNGLGATFTNSSLENNQVDGLGLDETLNLLFSEQINLLAATFARVGTNDEFKLLVNGNQFISADIPGGNGSDTAIGKFSFSPSPVGTLFGFTVTDNNDDYFLKSVEFTPIPTPALLPGLIGMGLAAIRKRKGEQAEQPEEVKA
jgi:hypothetical protein